jgi:dCTP deaminase
VDLYALLPGAFCTGWTAERISIPVNSRLAARVEGKSNLARLGVGIHMAAPTIHSGLEAQVQLEMFNFGPNAVILDADMRVCQLIFEPTVRASERTYRGSFAKQSARRKAGFRKAKRPR